MVAPTSRLNFGQIAFLMWALDRVDEEGRSIYVIDRDPSIFWHIFTHLETNERMSDALRKEASMS